MTVLARLDLSGQTDGAALTGIAAPWSLAGSGAATMVARADALRPGVMGIELNGSTGGTRRVSHSETTSATRVVGFEFMLLGDITAITYPQGGIDVSDIGGSRINVNETVAIRNVVSVLPGTGDVGTPPSPTYGTSASSLAFNHLYRFERKYDHAGNISEARVYDSESATPDNPIMLLGGGANSLTATQHTRFDFGLPAAAAGSLLRISAPVIADDWIGDAEFHDVDPPPDYSFPIPTPRIINHRSYNPGPGNTIDGFLLGLTVSAAIDFDIDLQRLAGGGSDPDMWAMCHDTTIDGLVHATSPIQTGEVDTDFTLPQWRTVRFRNQDNTGWALAGTLQDVADEFGPGGPSFDADRIFWLEVKTTSPYADGIAAIVNSGLAPHSVFSSFSRAAVQAAKAAGFMTQFITNAPVMAELIADEVDVLGINKANLTPQIIADATAAGILLCPYEINTVEERDQWIADGADLIVTGEPALLAPLEVPVGVGGGTFAYAGAGSGRRTPVASGGGSLTYQGSGAGERVPRATGGGSLAFAGSGRGLRTPVASGAGSVAYAGSGRGHRLPVATGGGSFAYAGTGHADDTPVGTGGGALTYAGSGAGHRAPVARGSGALAYAGTGHGRRVPVASGGGAFAYAGSGAGTVPGGLVARQWNGTEWVAVQAQRWNGSEWV